MSFSPIQLNAGALDQLSEALSLSLLRIAGETHAMSKRQSWHILLEILGHNDTLASEPDLIIHALRNREARKLLWRLLSAQMQSDLSVFEALGNIGQRREKIGFPEDFDQVIAAWRTLLTEGHPPGEFIVRYVLTVDFEEGMRLALNSKLGSFQDALAIEAGRP